MNVSELPGLQSDWPLASANALNFKPTCWPPSDDFPVTVDAAGNVLSRYGDVRWNLSPWAGTTLTMHFGDGPGQGQKISPDNASLLRLIVAWWIWGTAAFGSIKTVIYKFEAIKPLFVACTNNNVLASELYRYPKVIEDLSNYYSYRSSRLISCLHSLSFAEKSLGFSMLDRNGFRVLSKVLHNRESTQTAYIPPRIWTYQVSRLRECLDDFMANSEKIEACYDFSLEAHAINAGGSLSNAFGGLGINSPFNGSRALGRKKSGLAFHGRFSETIKRFELNGLFDKWVNTESNSAVSSISSYLSLISAVGLAYILNFSLMRVQEGSMLRASCHDVELDPAGDEIHTLTGVTTKTIEDHGARWIVSPTVKLAIEAMSIVAKLRLKAAKANPYIRLSNSDIENPSLQPLPHEPWSPRAPSSQPVNDYKKIRTYMDIWNIWPKLFDAKQLIITEADFEMASRLTYGLDPEKFSVGKAWPLAWHQLRRTGAVNMLASGLVTEASLQYQLKHASRAMSQYYGKNYYRLKEPLNDNARGYYLLEMYQAMVREFKSLLSDQYISPHGQKRKDQILSEISDKDHKQLLKAAKSGSVTYRQTFLGGCANSGPPCPLGGITNVSSCMGFGEERPCKSALLDKAKLPLIKKFREAVGFQLKDVEAGSPHCESLQAQLESAERAINVIEIN